MKDLEDRVLSPARFPRRLELRHPAGPPARPGPRPDPQPSRPAAGPGRPGPARPDRAAARRRRRPGRRPGHPATPPTASARLHASTSAAPRQRADKPRNDPRHKMTFPGHVLAAISSITGSPCPPAPSPPCSAATAPPSARSCPASPSSWPPTATTIPPGPRHPLATYQDLRDYAAGTASPCPRPRTDHTPPACHASHPATRRKLTLKKDVSLPGPKGPRTPLPGWPTHCDHHQMCDRASRRKASSEAGPVQAVTDMLRLRRAVQALLPTWNQIYPARGLRWRLAR